MIPVFSEDKIVTTIVTKNFGSVPTKNLEAAVFPKYPDSSGVIDFRGKESFGILFPNSRIPFNSTDGGSPETIKRIRDGKMKWILDVTITYDGIKTKGHLTEYSCLYNHKTNSFNISSGKVR